VTVPTGQRQLPADAAPTLARTASARTRRVSQPGSQADDEPSTGQRSAAGGPPAPTGEIWRESTATPPQPSWPALQRLSAGDVDTATDALSQAYSTVTIRPDPRVKNLRMEVAMCKLPNLSLGSLEISTSTVRSSCYPLIAVCLPVGGQILITSNCGSARVADGSAVVVSPGNPVVVEYLTDDCSMETLLFEQSVVEAELAGMLGAPVTKPLRFDLQFSPSRSSPFSRALTLLHSELRDPTGLTTVPAMSSQLGRLMMAGLLVSQTHNYTEELSRPRAVPGSKPIRNALQLIESQPTEIETVADIAASVGLSVRALDKGFHRYVGTPPMAYLRQVRMARAHDELLGADPQLTTAGTVARKWGFGHYGRFAAEYARRFGRKPSETLRTQR
jgi:AraC-like DNA-binding protein